jgi:hypothetical protein
MNQDQIDALVGGKDTDLHKHDQRYYTEAELDPELAKAVWLDGTRVMTGNLSITKDAPGVILTDDGGFVAQLVTDNDSLQIYCDPAGTIASSGFQVYIDGTLPGDQVLAMNAQGSAFYGWVSVNNGYLQVKGDESTDGYIYLYADQGDEIDDFWRIRAGVDGLFAIQNYPVSSWEDRFILHPTTGIRVDGLTMDGAIVIDSILDQDDFYSDSDTALATQQSIKKYVDDIRTMPSGVDQSGAGVGANEFWRTLNHATLPDHVVMIGI